MSIVSSDPDSSATTVKFKVRVTDNFGTGNPDAFSVRVTTGYSAGGDLTSGDIRILK